MKLLLALMLMSTCLSRTAAALDARPLAVKVMIINMFSFEAVPWLDALRPTREIRVPGLSSDYPLVKCTADAVCEMVTGMGHANAAASMMALLYSGMFDLRETYFIVAGIAGIDPKRGTIGSAAWARYAVDSGIAHEIDAREMPHGWQDGFFGVLTDGPGQVPSFDYRTEEFALNEALLQQAMSMSKSANRVAVLRSGSDFDRPYPHQGVLESIRAQRALPGAARVSAVNLVHAGMPLVEAIVRHWDVWRRGVPVLSVP